MVFYSELESNCNALLPIIGISLNVFVACARSSQRLDIFCQLLGKLSSVDSSSQKRRIFGSLLPIFGRQVEVDHCGCRWPSRPQWVRSVTVLNGTYLNLERYIIYFFLISLYLEFEKILHR